MFALPSLKLSWIVTTGNRKKVKSAVEYLSVSNDTFLNAHTPIQISLAHLFKEAAPFVKQYSNTLKQNLEFAISKLNSIENIEFIKPEGSFYLSLNLSKTKLAQKYDEESLVTTLMKKYGVFFHPGFFYDFKDGIYLILSFLCSKQKIERGIESLKDLLKI